MATPPKLRQLGVLSEDVTPVNAARCSNELVQTVAAREPPTVRWPPKDGQPALMLAGWQLLCSAVDECGLTSMARTVLRAAQRLT
jgi:hypothetical protein